MVQLSEEVSKLIEQELRDGCHPSADEVVRAAIANMRWNRREVQEFGNFAPGELAALIEEGERSGREEGWLTLEEIDAHMDEVERQLAERHKIK